jgi:hypothetical protein
MRVVLADIGAGQNPRRPEQSGEPVDRIDHVSDLTSR